MQFLHFISLVSFIPFTYQATTANGVVKLNEFSFDRIIRKFEASLIKFDDAFPHGEKHDAFVALAKDAKDVHDLLIGEVLAKAYEKNGNNELARKYGATENFPVVKLFIKGRKEPIHFDDSMGFTTDILRRFVRENTGLYLSLPGCVKELDKLAIKFMKSNGDDRDKILEETENIYKNLSKKEAPSGRIYTTIMKKILEKGDDFVKSETERVRKLQSGKISKEKKINLGIRLTILETFQLYEKGKNVKEEL